MTSIEPKYNWCLQLRETLSEVGMGFLWDNPEANMVSSFRASLIEKMKHKLTSDDHISAQKSKTIPSYCELKKTGDAEELLQKPTL